LAVILNKKMWKGKFEKEVHCRKFGLDKTKNPVTNRKMKEDGPSQRWFLKRCSRRTVGMNFSEFVKSRGKLALGGLITAIENYEDGKYLPDLLMSFNQVFKGAEKRELSNIILDLGSRRFKISVYGPLTKKLKNLAAKIPLDAIQEASSEEVFVKDNEDFCKARRIKNLPSRPPFQPQEHQTRSLELMRPDDSRLLLEHGLGSGKTCTSSMIISEYLETNPGNLVYFISPGGLRGNFINEYCTFCPVDLRKMRRTQYVRNIRFFSLDDSSLARKLPKKFQNCLVVVDEAQTLINSVRYLDMQPTVGDVADEEDLDSDTEQGKKGKNLVTLFDKLTKTFENIKLLLLSGTPMPDTLDQHYNTIILLKPYLANNMSYESFVDKFSMVDGRYIPREEVGNLYDRISFFKSNPQDVARVFEITEDVETPSESAISEIIIDAIEREDKVRIMPLESLVRTLINKDGMAPRKARQLAIMLKTKASRRDKSCRLSNFTLTDVDEKAEIERNRNDLDEYLEEYAPKLKRLVENLEDPDLCPGKQIIYCPFKISHGVNLIGYILKARGISHRVYSGDVSKNKREVIINDFNDPGNDNGEKIKVFIFTDAAAEGISLQTVRGVHLINESVYSSRMKQVIGRAIRYKSHIRLPEEDRYVNVFRYRLRVGDEGISSDHLNYERGISREYSLSYIQSQIHSEWSV